MTDTLHPALELHNGKPVGRDPRAMQPAELHALGHTNRSVLKAVAAHCVDCCSGKAEEARKCVAHECPLWAFRLGSNPLDRRNLTDDQRKASSERMKLNRAA